MSKDQREIQRKLRILRLNDRPVSRYRIGRRQKPANLNFQISSLLKMLADLRLDLEKSGDSNAEYHAEQKG